MGEESTTLEEWQQYQIELNRYNYTLFRVREHINDHIHWDIIWDDYRNMNRKPARRVGHVDSNTKEG